MEKNVGLGVVVCFSGKVAGGKRCVAGSRWERGPRVRGTEEMLLWGGRGGGKEGGARAGYNQPELGLGGDTKRDAVLRVP